MRYVYFVLFFLSNHLSAQNSWPNRFTASLGAGDPLAFTSTSTYANSIQATNLTNVTKTFPVSFTLKAEYFLIPYLSVGVSFNHLKYRMAFDADLLNWDTDSTYTHHVVYGDGRTNATLRLNVLFANKEKFAVYAGFGAGLMLATYYTSYVEPNMTVWGRDSDEIPFNLELTAGFRAYPFKKNRHIGFYTELGLAQSWLQAGITYRG